MNIERILFFASSDADYLEEIAFTGLSAVLGEGGLTFLPPRLKCYFSRKAYPRALGKFRSLFSYLPDLVKQPRSCTDFDCVILGSIKRDVFECYLHFQDRLSKHVPVVLIDGGDREEIGGDAKRLAFEGLFDEARKRRPFDIILKREFIRGGSYPSNVFPFPLGFRSDAAPFAQSRKKYDVVFWGSESHPSRAQAFDLLSGRFDCSSNGTTKNQNFKNFSRKGARYLTELSAARICCNFRGAGWDTLRYWEIPATGGFLLSQRPGIVIPDNFVDKSECVFCADDLHDLVDIADYFLKNEKEREEIAGRGRERLYSSHTHVKRAEYLLDILRARL